MAAPKQSARLAVTVGAVILGLWAGAVKAQEPWTRTQDTYDSDYTGMDSGTQTFMANANSQEIIEAAVLSASRVSSAIELDAIRLEIIMLRRFVVILGGIFFAFKVMVVLFKYH